MRFIRTHGVVGAAIVAAILRPGSAAGAVELETGDVPLEVKQSGQCRASTPGDWARA